MNQNERVESFLKELTELSKKYDLAVLSEGDYFLYDEVARERTTSFGMLDSAQEFKAIGMWRFTGEYKAVAFRIE